MTHVASIARILVVLAAACGGGGTAATDAGTDTPIDTAVAIPAGDFTCIGQPRTMTAADPTRISGKVRTGTASPLAGATVEIHAGSNDALLGTGTSSSGPANVGGYAIDVATGGAAPTIYRRSVASGKLDTYLFDPFPLFFSPVGPDLTNYTAAENTAYYSSLGITENPAKTSIDIIVLDCPAQSGSNIGATHAVAGAKVTVAGAERVIYINEQAQPDPNATATASSGYLSVFNAPAGPLDITVVAGPYTYRAAVVTTHVGAYTVAYVSP
jgi:hypothetical protein